MKLRAAICTALGLVILTKTGQLSAQTNYQVIKSFGFPASSSGANPQAGVILATNGMLYGVATSGGLTQNGVIYRMNTDGSSYQVLYSFAGAPTDGRYPNNDLLQASDGAIYGTTQVGGSNNDGGTIYKINLDGSGYQILHHFSGTTGQNPYAGVIEGREDGILYGTVSFGGTSYVYGGGVYKMAKDGTGYTLIVNPNGGQGQEPQAPVTEGPDGYLYGGTITGGSGNGTLFRVDRYGNNYSVLHSFSGESYGDGQWLQGKLVVPGDGYVYGATKNGGSPSQGNASYIGNGTLFKIGTTGSGYQELYLFPTTGTNGFNPYAGLTLGSDGYLYGATQYGGANSNGVIYKISTSGNFSVVVSLLAAQGNTPQGDLVQDASGNFYGTAFYGGTNNSGTVYKLNTNGAVVTVLHSFVTPSGGDGTSPEAPIFLSGTNGYGTTATGGTGGNGAVYRVANDGSGYVVLHSFAGGTNDGSDPMAAVIRASDGNLYGTTYNGGSANYGVIYKLDTNGGNYSILHNFGLSQSDGQNPLANLIQGADGALYGTTTYGGDNYYGTIFKLSTNGTGYTVLYSLQGETDGAYVYAPLVQGTDGMLYGCADTQGTNFGGTVFKLNTSGTFFTNLFSFSSDSNGASPQAGLIFGQDGLLYGSTSAGGSNYAGTLFKLATDGTGFTNLYVFGTANDDYASTPVGALVQATNGMLFGVTSRGGSNYEGIIYSVTTNGSFSVVYEFGTNGYSPLAGLSRGSTALYGTASDGGTSDFGVIYKLYPPVVHGVTITSLTYTPSSVTLKFTGGVASQTYSIYASTNVATGYQMIGSSIADTNGAFTYNDTTSAGKKTRYYRSYGP